MPNLTNYCFKPSIGIQRKVFKIDKSINEKSCPLYFTYVHDEENAALTVYINSSRIYPSSITY